MRRAYDYWQNQPGCYLEGKAANDGGRSYDVNHNNTTPLTTKVVYYFRLHFSLWDIERRKYTASLTSPGLFGNTQTETRILQCNTVFKGLFFTYFEHSKHEHNSTINWDCFTQHIDTITFAHVHPICTVLEMNHQLKLTIITTLFLVRVVKTILLRMA